MHVNISNVQEKWMDTSLPHHGKLIEFMISKRCRYKYLQEKEVHKMPVSSMMALICEINCSIFPNNIR